MQRRKRRPGHPRHGGGRQAQQQIHREKADGQWLGRGAQQQGVILEVQAPGHHAGQQVQAAEAQPQQEAAVAVVQTVDGEGGAARLAVPPAAHAVRRVDGAFKAPCDQHGKDLHGVFAPLEQAAGGRVAAHIALGLRDGAELAAEAGHEAQRHAQHQRQGGDDAAEEVDEFIGGHDGAEAAEPQHHRRQQQRGRRSRRGCSPASGGCRWAGRSGW